MKIFLLILGLIFALYHLVLTVRFSPRSSILYFWGLLGIYCIFLFHTKGFFILFAAPLALFFFLLFLFFLFWRRKNKEEPREVDLVLILGARCDGTQPESILEARVDLGERILKANPEAKCLLSGGQVFGETESEAATLKKHIKARGIKEERILLEEKSRTTKENFIFSFSLFPEGTKRAAVITSSFHLFRAEMTARSTNPPCPIFFLGAKNPHFFLPHLFIREFFTFSVDFLHGRIKINQNSEAKK